MHIYFFNHIYFIDGGTISVMGEWARFMTGRGRHILPSLLNASIERASETRAKFRRVVSLGRCGKSQKPDGKFLQTEETNLRKEIMVREMSQWGTITYKLCPL